MKTQFILALSLIAGAQINAQTPAAPPKKPAAPPPNVFDVQSLKGPDRNFANLSEAHTIYTQDFASKPGFGSGRMLFLPSQDFVTLDGSVYRFNTPELIGLENDPVVYQRAGGIQNLSVDVMSKKELRARLTKRALTAVESNAVVQLRAGKDLVTQKELVQTFGERGAGHTMGLRAVGSLRAQANCAHCHGVKEGTLLGAFSYTLVPTNLVAGKPVSAPVQPQPVQPTAGATNLNFTLADWFGAFFVGMVGR